MKDMRKRRRERKIGRRFYSQMNVQKYSGLQPPPPPTDTHSSSARTRHSSAPRISQ